MSAFLYVVDEICHHATTDEAPAAALLVVRISDRGAARRPTIMMLPSSSSYTTTTTRPPATGSELRRAAHAARHTLPPTPAPRGPRVRLPHTSQVLPQAARRGGRHTPSAALTASRPAGTLCTRTTSAPPPTHAETAAAVAQSR